MAWLNENVDEVARGQHILVTALICNYNYGRYVAEAVDSALAQTWENVEVVVVDDGSTDNSRDVLAQYGDRIRIIHKKNGGQASAFNVGIAAARGDIICFLDSDDRWFPEKVATVVEKYRGRDWGLVWHDLKEFSDDCDRVRGVGFVGASGAPFLEGRLGEKIAKDVLRPAFSPTSGLSLTRKLAQLIAPLPEDEWRLCADSPLAYAAMMHAPVGVVSECLGCYRVHGENGFLSARGSQLTWVVAVYLNSVKRQKFLKEYVAREGIGLEIEDLWGKYKFLRMAVLLETARPWRHLGRLWAVRWREKWGETIGFGLLECFRDMVRDSALVVLTSWGLHRRYGGLRRTFGIEVSKMPGKFRAHLFENQAIAGGREDENA